MLNIDSQARLKCLRSLDCSSIASVPILQWCCLASRHFTWKMLFCISISSMLAFVSRQPCSC